MEIGSNLKKLRTSKGMTQKDLADRLNVSSQAVSRWENDEVEPDISTLSKLSTIFEVPVDAIINGNFEKKDETKDDSEAIAAVATTIAAVAKTNSKESETTSQKVSNEGIKDSKNQGSSEHKVVGVCYGCGKVIRDGDKHNTITKPETTSTFRGHKHVSPGYTRLYCSECDTLRVKGKLSSEGKRLPKFGKKRLIFGLIFGIVTLIGSMIGLFVASNVSAASAIFLPVLFGYAVFAEIYCLFTDCYIGELFVDVASFSIKMPGIIFSFDLGGFVFLIVMKILFAIIGFFIGIAVFLFAVALTAVLSVFTFPFVIGHEAI